MPLETLDPNGFPPEYNLRLRNLDTQYNGARVFENVVYLGYPVTSAYAIDTGDGLILIDSLNSAAHARDLIVPGLEAAGLDPFDIEYVVISHEHSDHYGGASYLKETFGAKIAAGSVAEAGLPAQLRPLDVALNDGDELTLGTTTLRFRATPGHSPGTMSIFFDVTDFDGREHTVGVWGGPAFPSTLAARRQMAASLEDFAARASRENVDVLLSTHPDVALGTRFITEMRQNGPTPNPFVRPNREIRKAFDIMAWCYEASIRKLGSATGT
jgi:metallo-beta-lactamase class B